MQSWSSFLGTEISFTTVTSSTFIWHTSNGFLKLGFIRQGFFFRRQSYVHSSKAFNSWTCSRSLGIQQGCFTQAHVSLIFSTLRSLLNVFLSIKIQNDHFSKQMTTRKSILSFYSFAWQTADEKKSCLCDFHSTNVAQLLNSDNPARIIFSRKHFTAKATTSSFGESSNNFLERVRRSWKARMRKLLPVEATVVIPIWAILCFLFLQP